MSSIFTFSSMFFFIMSLFPFHILFYFLSSRVCFSCFVSSFIHVSTFSPSPSLLLPVYSFLSIFSIFLYLRLSLHSLLFILVCSYLLVLPLLPFIDLHLFLLFFLLFLLFSLLFRLHHSSLPFHLHLFFLH